MARAASGAAPAPKVPTEGVDRMLKPVGSTSCPVGATLDLLSGKWTFRILRDLTSRPPPTFTDLLARNPGLTPRVLASRLSTFHQEELVEKILDPKDHRKYRYRLTSKGRDAIPVLTALAAFGIKHLAERVFPDGKPRTMEEAYPGRSGELLGGLLEYASAAQPANPPVERRRGPS